VRFYISAAAAFAAAACTSSLSLAYTLPSVQPPNQGAGVFSITQVRAVKSELRWLVISSRPTLPEAIAVAQSFSGTLGSLIIAQSTNGRYAIIAGSLDTSKAKANLEALKSIKLIPADSFLSLGDSFTYVWGNQDYTLQFVYQPRLRETVQRLQAAFARLNLYDGAIDGAIGPGTTAAFREYSKKYGNVATEVIDPYTLSAIEQVAVDGFASEAERQLAREGGFSDADSFHDAQKRGFQTSDAQQRAKLIGLSTYAELDAFDKSGFSTKVEFEKAKADGFSNKQQYDEHAQAAFRTASADAKVLIDDAEAFLRINSKAPNIVEIASLVGRLKETIAGRSYEPVIEATTALSNSLMQLDGFAAFQEASSDERRRKRDDEVSTLSADLQARTRASRTWIAQHLSNPASADLADEIKTIESGGVQTDPEALRGQLSRLNELMRRWKVKAEIDVIMASGGKSESTPGDSSEFHIDRTPENKFLLDGDGQERVFLYNSSPEAPSIIRNLVGNFLFEGKVATVCAMPSLSNAERRALLGVLAPFEANRLEIMPTCTAGAMKTSDLVVIQRREFLKSEPSLVVATLGLVKTGELRRFDPVSYTSIVDKITAEEKERTQIADDVKTGARSGFGALITPDGRSRICMVVADGKVHSAMVSRIQDFLRSEDLGEFDTSNVDAETAFRSLQRQDCRVVYASQGDLKTISSALTDDNRSFAFLPVWFDQEEVARVSSKLGEQEKLITEEREKKRLEVEEQERLRADKEQRRQTEAAAIETELRAKNGPEARGLQTQIADGLKALIMNPEPTASAASVAKDLFPKLDNWQGGLENDHWQADGLSTEIADYGVAEWKGRSIKAIVVEAKVNLVSRERGERQQQCFLLGVLSDEEFNMFRDSTEYPCTDGEPEIAKWKTGHRMVSKWHAS
jgi:hypothetical protein